MFQVRNLPWRLIRDIGFTARVVVASKKRPNRKHLVVDAPIEELEVLFGENHYRSGWFLSYHYHGEDANLSRGEYNHGEYNNLQHHIRLFERGDDRTELLAHMELCPIEHPRAHLNGVMQDVEGGIRMAQSQLERKNVVYEVIEPE